MSTLSRMPHIFEEAFVVCSLLILMKGKCPSHCFFLSLGGLIWPGGRAAKESGADRVGTAVQVATNIPEARAACLIY
jgi:hypothetical protein